MLSDDQKAELGRFGHPEGLSNEEASKYINLLITAFSEYSDTKETYRGFGAYPYFLHTLSVATSLDEERSVAWEERELGFKLIICSDIRNRTSMELPEWIPSEVLEAVEKMSYPADKNKLGEDFNQYIDSLPKELAFLVLYARVKNLREQHVHPNNREGWIDSIKYMLSVLSSTYDKTRIFQEASLYIDTTDWSGHQPIS